MTMCKKCAALLLAVCVIVGLAGCGKQNPDGLHAHFSQLYSADFPQAYLDEPDAFRKEIDGFGVEDFAATFADPAAFQCFNAEIRLSNENDFAVNILSMHVDPKNVGKGGVYFGTYGDGAAVGLPADFTDGNSVFYTVIADASLTEEQVMQALEEMRVTVIYVDAAVDAETPEEAEASALLKSVITCEA